MSRLDKLTPAQRDAVTALSDSLCVTSGAGCGKTRVLVERYIHFLEQDLALPLAALAAITFTENAAAEMRGRIRQACRDQMDLALAANDVRRLEIWRSRYWDVDVAPIDTIHSFCSGLLRRYPIEAQVDPGFGLLDEAESTFLRTDVAAAVIEQLLAAADADLLAVLEHFGLTEMHDLLAGLVGEEREALQRIAAPVMARSDDEILRDLKRAMDEATFNALRACLTSPEVMKAIAVLAAAQGAPADRREQARAAAVAAVEEIRRARTADLARAAAGKIDEINLRGGSAKAWPSKEAFDDAGAALKALRETVRDALSVLPPYDDAVERTHLALARAFYRTAGRAIEAYEAAKRERSALDFEDLQIRVRDLLRDHADVLGECRRRFRAILVDELQDTNPLQFEIIDLLTSEPAARGKPAALRAGALFGVGDPKQSIYRFRGADVAVFRRVMDRVTDAGRHSLHESFRLHPGVAGLANHLFPPLMGDDYEPIEGKHEQKNAAVGELLLVREPPDDRFDTETGHAAEAVRLASRVAEIVEGKSVTVWDEAARTWRPARYGDVAVLMRRMTHLHLYEEALERRGVPYYVVAGSGFYKQQEVLDVLHLLRVLDDPDDDLHLAGVLRSPFFAVSDEGLLRLRRLGGRLHDALPRAVAAAGLAEEDRRGLARAAALLPRWRAMKDRLGLGALVDRVALASGYAAASVGRFGGARAYANLRQMVELARRFERRGLTALGDYVVYVTDFMQSEMREEQAPLDAQGGDTVRLMTIHKAKGLEFPIVAIPDLGYLPRPSTAAYFIHPATGVAVRTRDEDGERILSGSLALARLENARADAKEYVRILYVAITRAKDYLLFASHVSEIQNRRGVGSWLGALLCGLNATEEDGERTVRLPGGEEVRIISRPPEKESPRRGKRRGGPHDVFSAGRVLWHNVRGRAAQASPQRVRETLNQIDISDAVPRPPRRITATALATYQRCPRLYWWTNVLGVDDPGPPNRVAGLPAMQWGVLAHRALELAAGPDAASVQHAVDGALRELVGVAEAARDELRRRLTDAVAAFWAGPLGQRVAAARQTHRELPLLMTMDATEIHGTMDLLFEGSDGGWEIVDYKATAVPADRADAAAATYELQLALYAMAAGRHLGRPVARWSVHFLGSGIAATREVTATSIERARAMANEALKGLAAGHFECKDTPACSYCRHRPLCDAATGRGQVLM